MYLCSVHLTGRAYKSTNTSKKSRYGRPVKLVVDGQPLFFLRGGDLATELSDLTCDTLYICKK
jgi:hypothetical protein